MRGTEGLHPPLGHTQARWQSPWRAGGTCMGLGFSLGYFGAGTFLARPGLPGETPGAAWDPPTPRPHSQALPGAATLRSPLEPAAPLSTRQTREKRLIISLAS